MPKTASRAIRRVGVSVADPSWKDKAPALRSVISKACLAVLKAECEEKLVMVGFRLVSDDEMQALNHQFRGQEKTTNVLSFPDGETHDNGLVYLGDIVLSTDTLRHEAREQKKTLPKHLTHLTVHGTLHLLGYDHEVDAEAEVMEEKEILILKGLGVSNPYA